MGSAEVNPSDSPDSSSTAVFGVSSAEVNSPQTLLYLSQASCSSSARFASAKPTLTTAVHASNPADLTLQIGSVETNPGELTYM